MSPPSNSALTQAALVQSPLGEPSHLLRPNLVLPQLDLKTPEGRALTQTGLWVEIQLLSDREKPIPDERVLLAWTPGALREARTNAEGIVRFTGLELRLDVSEPGSDMPRVILPDILEEHTPQLLPSSFKGRGGGDDRRRDGAVRLIPWGTARFPVIVRGLTAEEKFLHFHDAYVDHGAKYGTGKGNDYYKKDRRWSWSKGSVCNQHVNFFLGYWFNYNEHFTARGSGTFMINLPLYDSAIHDFRPLKQQKADPKKDTSKETVSRHHRGYREFLEPVTGLGISVNPAYDPAKPDTVPASGNNEAASRVTEYIRLSEFFNEDGTAQASARSLIDALAPFNVYSIASIHGAAKEEKALDAVRAWLKKHKATLKLDDKGIEKLKPAALWTRVWKLRRDADPDRELWHQLRGMLDFDHHAGIVLKRGPGKSDPTDVPPEQLELWTFSADGTLSSARPIVLRPFGTAVAKGSHFKHLAFWKLKALRPGGFIPLSTEQNAAGISLETPPRFIHWHS